MHFSYTLETLANITIGLKLSFELFDFLLQQGVTAASLSSDRYFELIDVFM